MGEHVSSVVVEVGSSEDVVGSAGVEVGVSSGGVAVGLSVGVEVGVSSGGDVVEESVDVDVGVPSDVDVDESELVDSASTGVVLLGSDVVDEADEGVVWDSPVVVDEVLVLLSSSTVAWLGVLC